MFSVNIEYLILRGQPLSMICDITNGLEANPGPLFSKNTRVTWKLETSSAHTLRVDFTEIGFLHF